MRLVIYGPGAVPVHQVPVVPISGVPAGVQGQVVGYDAAGNPVAVDMTAASLPPGQPGQVLGYGPDGTASPRDPRIPLESAQW